MGPPTLFLDLFGGEQPVVVEAAARFGFLAARLDVVVEAAGQPAVRALGERCLRAGADLVVTSTGAFTDDALLQALRAAAGAQGSGRLHLASGAMPGLDWMQSVAMAGGDGARGADEAAGELGCVRPRPRQRRP